MLHQRLSRTGSRSIHVQDCTRAFLVGCLALVAVGLAACGEGPPPCERNGILDPARCPPPPPPPFRVDVNNGAGAGADACRITLSAAADGGEDGSYAVWGEIVAKVFDDETQEFREVPHPFGRSSDIFGADRIEKGQMQSGQIDLACFRQTVGQEVWVELEIHYTIVDGDAPAEADSELLQLQC